MSQSTEKRNHLNAISRRGFVTSCIGGSAFSLLATRAEMTGSGTIAGRTETSGATMVWTMKGPVSCNSLGTTLMHEHLFDLSGAYKGNPGYTEIAEIPDDERAETVRFDASLLNDAARVGIDTIVDLTPYRPIDLYEQIASRTTVNIVPCTGFFPSGIWNVPRWMAEMNDEKQMEHHMLKEVTEGIDGTNIRAGIIKVASLTSPISDREKKFFRAAARVQKAMGVRIATHVGGNAREQLDLLVQAGAEPALIFFSHVDMMLHGGRTREEVRDLLVSVAQEGGYMEVDTFGYQTHGMDKVYTGWSDLVFLLRSICDAGFANRIFPSMDCNWHWANGKKWFEGSEAPYFDPDASKRTFAYLITDAVPRLLKSGFSQKEIHTFLVDNPRRFFGGE